MDAASLGFGLLMLIALIGYGVTSILSAKIEREQNNDKKNKK